MTAREAWRRAFVGQQPEGGRRPWSTLYRALVRAERMAAWAKVYCWRRSVRRQ